MAKTDFAIEDRYLDEPRIKTLADLGFPVVIQHYVTDHDRSEHLRLSLDRERLEHRPDNGSFPHVNATVTVREMFEAPHPGMVFDPLFRDALLRLLTEWNLGAAVVYVDGLKDQITRQRKLIEERDRQIADLTANGGYQQRIIDSFATVLGDPDRVLRVAEAIERLDEDND